MRKCLIIIVVLTAASLPAYAMGLINIQIGGGPFAGFLCDNGAGACLGGTAGFLLDDSSGKLIAV
jgi:hypothetical protein